MEQHQTTVFKETTLHIGDVLTHVRIAGKGEPLLWLHGGSGMTALPPFFEKLAEQHEIYLVDHPGYGKSEWYSDKFRDYEDYTLFYRDFLDHYQLEKVNIAGHSLGGRVALEFAISQPHRVKKLLLLCSSGVRVEGVKRTDMFMLSPEERVRKCYYDGRLAEQVLAREKTDEEKMIEIKNLAMYARLTWERPDHPKFPRLLRYVKAPTAIIWGREDAVLPVAHGHYLHEHIAGSELHILPECGHIPHVEKGEECLNIMNLFLLS